MGLELARDGNVWCGLGSRWELLQSTVPSFAIPYTEPRRQALWDRCMPTFGGLKIPVLMGWLLFSLGLVEARSA